MRFLAILLLGLAAVSCVVSQSAPASLVVDWPSFLARSDPVWVFGGPDRQAPFSCKQTVSCSRFPIECDAQQSSDEYVPSDDACAESRAPRGGPLLPTRWFESAFAGNGNMGVMVTANLTDHEHHKTYGASFIKFELGRTDVYDNRPPGANYSVGNFVYDRPRLGIGSLYLNLTGSIIGGGMRIVLHDAEIVGNVTTTAGSAWFRAYVHATMDVLVIESSFTGSEPLAPAKPFTLIPEIAASSWAGSDPSVHYEPNPPAKQRALPSGSLVTQSLLTGSAYSTAFTCNTTQATRLTVLSVSPVLADPAASKTFVKDLISAAEATGADGLLRGHRAWWHAYWPQSFLTMSDSRVEAFYWIQMYKLASATRANGTVFDLEGPWFVYGSYWPDLHWDLNIQLAYFPVYTSNRLDLGLSLTNFITAIAPNFAKNVPIQWADDSYAAPVGASALDGLQSCYWVYGEDCLTTPPAITGNLLWVLHNFYKQYAYSQDPALLQQLFPILRKAVNFYYHFIFAESTGAAGGHTLSSDELMAVLRSDPQRLADYKLHLPPTFSPEYSYLGPDTNYDLALLRWALQTLLTTARQLGVDDPLESTWQATLSHLVAYPQGPDGYWIAAGVPLNESHRHFSHLLMIFPLQTINFTDPTELQLATVSLDHWIGLTGQLTGFCRTAVSSMSSLLGRRAAAYSNVTFLLDNYLHVNTMYEEGGFPCGETPPAAASSVQDMYLQSVGAEIRVFPGLSDQDIPEAAFYHLRASGGVLVSGARSKGKTGFIQVESPSGGPCTITADLFSAPFEVAPDTVKMARVGPETFTFEFTQSGSGWFVVLPTDTQPNFQIVPAAGEPAQFNWWGLH